MNYTPSLAEPFIPLSRALVALVAAPILPCLIFTVMSGGLVSLPTLFLPLIIYAELFVFALGMPAVFVLLGKVRPRLIWALLYGGFVAAAPFAFLLALSGQSPQLDDVTFVGLIFGLGIVGGAVFWLIAALPAYRLQKDGRDRL